MLALARKYRPRSFASVAVQSHVSNTLKGAVARGRVASGYLLCGPRGVGKTTLARVLAMALNCANRSADGEPCGVCGSCQRIWSGSTSLDVVEIDAASNRGVDDARDLRERAMYAPSSEDRYKVYIVDEAHMLTREAWNALLKILEEPPPRVVFVFATTEPQKIAQTAAPVLSRLQRFDFRRIGPGDVRARLTAVLAEEGVESEPDAIAMIARAADGSMRDALSLTDQAMSMGEGALTAERVRESLGIVAEDEYLAILDLIAERRAGDVFATVGRLAELGVDFGTFLGGLADILRAQLAVALGAAQVDVSERTRAALAERTDRLTPADLLRMISAIVELEPRFRKSAQQQLLLETLLVRFALLDRTVAIEEVLRGIGGQQGGPSERTAVRDDRPADAAPARRQTSPPRAAVDVAGAAPPPDRAAGARPPRADAGPSRVPAAASGLPDINVVAERLDDVVASVRSSRAVLASFLERALPTAVAAGGVLTVQPDDEAAAVALENGKVELLGALNEMFPAIQRVVVRGAAGAESAGPPRRLTEDEIRAQRMASLRKRDPVLDAAIDTLDLELLD